MIDRAAFYEMVTATVKLDPQTIHDEWLVGEDWVKVAYDEVLSPQNYTLQTTLTSAQAAEAVEAQAKALPEDRFLFVFYFNDDKGVRVGFFRTPSASVLEWGSSQCPPWFRWSTDAPSRYAKLMEDE